MTDSIPTWEEFMIPALEILSDGQTHRARHICNAAADTLEISEQDRLELIPSGQPRYLNRSLWALSYLFRAGAVDFLPSCLIHSNTSPVYRRRRPCTA